MAAITGSRDALETRIEGVSIEVNLLRDDLRKMSDKVHSAEGNIDTLKLEVASLKKQVSQMQQTSETLAYRVEDAEGRARLNNLRFLGFPERSEGQDTETFMENWIRGIVQSKDLSNHFVIERVHRALVPLHRPGPHQEP